MRTQDRPWLRLVIDLYKSYKLRKAYYNKENSRATNTKKQIIYMADGKILHGGLSDRLCGIVSMYAYAKKYDCDFKIYFVEPYNLTEFLLPNQYDWRIEENELSYSSKDACPVYLPHYSNNYEKTVKYIDSRLKGVNVKQIHAYSNTRYFTKENFHILFNELFKPCKRLKEALNTHISVLTDDYVSLTFRFQQLLGDFKEGNFATMDDEQSKEMLIQKCLNALEFLHSQVGKKKILVTSDSITFLKHASELYYAYVVLGNIRHMDFTSGEKVDISVDMKSYVDMFLLASAKEIYLCNISPLYRSGFPETSSFIQGKPYFEIVDKNNDFHIIRTDNENCN